MDINNEYNKAKNIAFRYLAIKDRSVYEVKTYLKKQNITEEIVEDIINNIIDKGYLNDYRFAARFCEKKFSTGRWGLEKIKGMLMVKGIDRLIIEEVISNYSENDQYQTAKKLIEKKYSQEISNLQWVKIARFLRNKGFSEIIIKKIYYNYDKT